MFLRLYSSQVENQRGKQAATKTDHGFATLRPQLQF